MATSLMSPQYNDLRTFRHHGRDLVLVPGKQLLAYALKKGPAPYFPATPQSGGDQQDRSNGGWGQPISVHGSSDETQDEEDDGGWGEPISRHGEDAEENEGTNVDDPSEPVEWGHIDESGIGYGCIDLVWALDGVPSWDGVKYNTLSEESQRLIEAVSIVNAGVPPADRTTPGDSNPASTGNQGYQGSV
jgi:hypothetical protein